MSSSIAFTQALTATGYLQHNGTPVPGLALSDQSIDARLRPVFSDSRVNLQADAVFSTQRIPVAIFKDAGSTEPTEAQLAKWHEAAWNIGVAPLLWIVTPTNIRLYDCYASPDKASDAQPNTVPLGVFSLDSEDRLQALDTMCGRFATETGSFWSSDIGKRIDRRHRVDRELLSEIKALEERLTILPLPAGTAVDFPNPRDEVRASRDFAQRLIGRCIFTSYLIDRGIAQRFLPPDFPTTVAGMFATVDSAFRLFQWLRSTFNGDLFPMDDPGAEQQRLGDAHLALLRDFIEGISLVSGQGRLFRFRYEAIPVDLISSIYQQFARSSAEDVAHVQGLHYTPIELVHLTLDPVFEALPATARVIDPTCGSGAFLVEAFRRLVWKHCKGRLADRATVRKVLYEQLYGIDINRSALGIAAFSLYLAALELDEDPVVDIADLKFHRLIGTTLFEADAVGGALPDAVTKHQFHAVVGNPPWTFVRQATTRRRTQGDERDTRPRRSPDQEFLWTAIQLAGESGRIGMIMKASPFFSKDQHAVVAREALLRKLSPVALVNLSALRKEELFPDASGPALLLFARCSLLDSGERLLIGSIPWTPDFRRTGVFHIGPGEMRSVSLARVLRVPPMLKAVAFGSIRDGWLIEKLERTFPTLDALLDKAKLQVRGQGFQIEGGDNNLPPEHYYSLRVLVPAGYEPLRLSLHDLNHFTHLSLHRPRNAAIFQGPLLLCPKGNLGSAIESGRYSATLSTSSVLYNKNFYGVSFAGKDPLVARVLIAILNSSLTAFQLAFGGSTWGLERPTVEPNDLLSLRMPDLTEAEPELIQTLLEAEQALADDPQDAQKIAALDKAVYRLYDLERDEMVIADESMARARMLLFESRQDRTAFIGTPTRDSLVAYASEVVHTVNAYLRARGQRHLEAVVFPQRVAQGDLANGIPGITAVRFTMAAGSPTNSPVLRHGDTSEIEQLMTMFIKGLPNSGVPPYLNERRQLRIYDKNDLIVMKPSEARYWTRTAGLNDADVILADHWTKERHAPVV